MRIRSLVFVVAVVAMVASACSSTASHASLRDPAVAGTAQERTTPSSTAPDADQTQRLAVAQVGAEAGGVVELAGRVRFTIPPGSLTADAEVRLTAIGAVPSAIAFPLEQPVAPAVNVEIRGAELTEPATLEFLFDPDVVDLPDDPIIATSSQWVDIGWLLLDSSIDPDGGVVTTTSTTPNGWWRPGVWDWSRLPAVVDRAVVGLDATSVPEPGCTTAVPAWVQRVELGQVTAAPAHVCAGGFGQQLAVRMTNRRPFSLAVESSQSPSWGWTNTHDQLHLRLTEIVRSVQPGFVPQLILPRLTEGAIGIDPGNFAGGRIVGRATSTTMAIDVATLVLDAVGVVDLDGWESLLACAIPSEDGPVQSDQATEVVERLSRCARRLEGSESLPSGYRDGVLAVLDLLVASDPFAASIESMMATANHRSGVLYWTDPSQVASAPAAPRSSAAEDREPLPLPPGSFASSSPTPPVATPEPAVAPSPAAARTTPTTRPVAEPPATNPPATQPPATQPPATLPPVTAAPPTVPPTVAPTTSPPTTEQKRRRGRGRRDRDGDDDDDDD